MSIPRLTANGLLPPGTHPATLAEIEARYGWNAHRQVLWKDGMRFLRTLIDRDLSYPLVMAGSFTTDKTLPPDLDMVLDMTGAEEYHQFMAVQMFRRERILIREDYRVDFCVNIPNNNDFCDFFQYVGEKTALQKGLNAKDRRGVLRVQSWADGLKT